MTDHKPLLSIFGAKKGIPVHSANRLQRWVITLLAYDFQIKFTSTLEFGHADVLSRLISNQTKQEEDYVIAITSIEVDSEYIVTYKQIQQATRECPILNQICQFVTSNNK